MLETNTKAEIQAISSISLSYLSDQYPKQIEKNKNKKKEKDKQERRVNFTVDPPNIPSPKDSKAISNGKITKNLIE